MQSSHLPSFIDARDSECDGPMWWWGVGGVKGLVAQEVPGLVTVAASLSLPPAVQMKSANSTARPEPGVDNKPPPSQRRRQNGTNPQATMNGTWWSSIFYVIDCLYHKNNRAMPRFLWHVCTIKYKVISQKNWVENSEHSIPSISNQCRRAFNKMCMNYNQKKPKIMTNLWKFQLYHTMQRPCSVIYQAVHSHSVWHRHQLRTAAQVN